MNLWELYVPIDYHTDYYLETEINFADWDILNWLLVITLGGL